MKPISAEMWFLYHDLTDLFSSRRVFNILKNMIIFGCCSVKKFDKKNNLLLQILMFEDEIEKN